MRRLLVIVLLLAAAGAAGYFLLWQENASEPAKQAPGTGNQSEAEAMPRADIVAQAIELTQGMAGRISWRLKARTGQYEESSGIIKLDEPRVIYFLGKERSEIRLGSHAGTVYQKQDRVVLTDEVTGAYDVFDIAADQLDYEGGQGELLLTGGVQLKRSGLTLNSDRAVIHLLDKNMTAVGNVTAVIRRDELETTPKQGGSEE